ncbi:hypothetical protein Tco_0300715 [Tanacetum coccineum]
MEQMTSICDMVGQIMQKKEEDRRITEDQEAKDRYWKIPICYDDDEDYTIAITPVLSTNEPVDSLIMEDEHLDAIPAMESDEVIKSSVENLVPIPSEFEGIFKDTCDVPICEDPSTFDALNDHSEILSDSNDDGTSSDDDDFEDIDGSTTTRSDYSFPDYEAFYLDDDHVEEKSSGSTTTHADFSQYDLFIFDLSINLCPPADRSDCYHEKFAGELAHIISPPEYDCFYFKSEPDPGELTSIVDSGIRENVLSTTNVNLPFEDAQSPLLAYVSYPQLHLGNPIS